MAEVEDGSEEESEEFDAWDEREEPLTCTSLLNNSIEMPSVADVLDEAAAFGFDACAKLCAENDFYARVKLVNYMRSIQQHWKAYSASADKQTMAHLLRKEMESLQSSSLGDTYLQPVITSDALLMALDSLKAPDEYKVESQDDKNSSMDAPGYEQVEQCAPVQAAPSSAEQLQHDKEFYTATQAADENERVELLRLLEAQPNGSSTSNEGQLADNNAVTSDVDSEYFASYSQLDIHRTMLEDSHRTETYRTALECNPSCTAGAQVLDVGCGCGILSMFAARGGRCAKAVGIDGSADAVRLARAAVQANGFANGRSDGENSVDIIHGRLETLINTSNGLLGEQSFDVIVSEWMGYCLLAESMLGTIATARDRLLKPGGAVLPDRAHIHLAGCTEDGTGLGFWNDVCGLNLSCVALEAKKRSHGRALVHDVHASSIVTTEQTVLNLDLMSATARDSDFTSDFSLRPTAEECTSKASVPVQVCAMVLWFDVDFSERFCKECPQTLSTAPSGSKTHWSQTVLLLEYPHELRGADDSVQGRISFSRCGANLRSIAISVESATIYSNGSRQQEQINSFTL